MNKSLGRFSSGLLLFALGLAQEQPLVRVNTRLVEGDVTVLGKKRGSN
jgi:hypothetical protein